MGASCFAIFIITFMVTLFSINNENNTVIHLKLSEIQGETQLMMLIPELCCMTDLTDFIGGS